MCCAVGTPLCGVIHCVVALPSAKGNGFGVLSRDVSPKSPASSCFPHWSVDARINPPICDCRAMGKIYFCSCWRGEKKG